MLGGYWESGFLRAQIASATLLKCIQNGGHCQPLLSESPNDPSVGVFELANFHALQHLIKTSNIDCEFVAQPGVRAIYSQHHLDELELSLHTMQTTAPELARMMRVTTSKSELAKYRIPTAMGALITSVAARMWPYKFVARILEDLLTSPCLNGTFNLQTLTPALSLIRPHHDETRWTVQTPRGAITASKVIIATNGYTSHLLHDFADLIVPCRGQMSALQPLESVAGAYRVQTSLGFLGDGLDDYLIQRPNETGGHLMFGGGRQHGPSIGETDDSDIDPKTAHYLRTRLVSAFALPEGSKDQSAQFSAAAEWTGIMGFSRDEHPFVGPVPSRPGVFISAGYTGHGMPNTWLCGKAVAVMAQQSMLERSEVEVVERAIIETGLPRAYVCSQERMTRVMQAADVGAQDWAEMQRGQAGRGRDSDRVPSGYA